MIWQFWRWLFRGLNHRPGYRQFISGWLVVQVAVSVGLALAVEVSIHDAARAVLLPLIAIFVGLSLAWVGNAQALLQEAEIEKLAKYHPDGIWTYVYTFQLAILVMLTTVVFWGLAALGVLSAPFLCHDGVQFSIETWLYLLTTLTVRECWHVVMASQLLILSRYIIRKTNESSSDSREPQ